MTFFIRKYKITKYSSRNTTGDYGLNCWWLLIESHFISLRQQQLSTLLFSPINLTHNLVDTIIILSLSKDMIVSGYNSCWGTNVSGHSHVWAQSCLATNVSGQKHVWAQSWMGTIVWVHPSYGCTYGCTLCRHKRVSAQTCLEITVCRHKSV